MYEVIMKRLTVLAFLALTNPPIAQDQPENADVDALVKDLDSADRETRLNAINALAEIGPDAKKAVPGLIKILHVKDEELRLNAALALGKMGKDAVAPLAKLLGDKDLDTRYYAISALGWIGKDAKETA